MVLARRADRPPTAGAPGLQASAAPRRGRHGAHTSTRAPSPPVPPEPPAARVSAADIARRVRSPGLCRRRARRERDSPTSMAARCRRGGHLACSAPPPVARDRRLLPPACGQPRPSPPIDLDSATGVVHLFIQVDRIEPDLTGRLIVRAPTGVCDPHEHSCVRAELWFGGPRNPRPRPIPGSDSLHSGAGSHALISSAIRRAALAAPSLSTFW